MIRLTMCVLTALATIGLPVFTTGVHAQNSGGQKEERPEPGRNRGPRDGFPGRGQFGLMSQFGLLGLLRIEEVQQEVKLSKDQLTAIQSFAEESNSGRPEPPGDFRELTDEQRDTFRKSMDEWHVTHNEAVKEKLKTIVQPEQFDRIMQISIQQQGAASLRDQDVATKLNLSEEQRTQIASAIDSSLETLRTEMRSTFSGGPGGGDREAIRKKVHELRADMDETILSMLTAEQKEAFIAMKGEAFELPEPGPGGRGGEQGGRPRRNRKNDKE